MSVASSPRVFISYSHDSPEHEERVLRLANQLRNDGVDARIDQYEGSPAEGWPFWMERQIREADAVLVVCTATHQRRVEHREEPHKGHGVLWEANIIYNHLYADRTVSAKFLPVRFEPGTAEYIPLPLRSFMRYHLDTTARYDTLYRKITQQPQIQKPTLGALKRLPTKERSDESLPGAFSLEQLSKTMANPKYADDLFGSIESMSNARSLTKKP